MLRCVSFLLGNALVRKIVRLVVFTITDLKRFIHYPTNCRWAAALRHKTLAAIKTYVYVH